MHASLVPTANDLAGLLAYVLGNPYLFISSSTVMTTGLVLGAVAVSMVPRSAPVMRVAGPPLAMLLVYFGVGSIVLATEILVRFHDSIPDATETQFVSGVGHLLERFEPVEVALHEVADARDSRGLDARRDVDEHQRDRKRIALGLGDRRERRNAAE